MTKTLRVILTLLLIIWTSLGFTQDDIIKLVDSIKYADGNYNSCNSTYWRIIKSGRKTIPLLISKMTDTAKTKAIGHCKKNFLTIGEVAYLTLKEIVDLPLFEITEIEFDVIDTIGCLIGFSDYLQENQQLFQNRVKKWYDKNKSRLVWKRYNSYDLTICQRENGILGYYTLR